MHSHAWFWTLVSPGASPMYCGFHSTVYTPAYRWFLKSVLPAHFPSVPSLLTSASAQHLPNWLCGPQPECKPLVHPNHQWFHWGSCRPYTLRLSARSVVGAMTTVISQQWQALDSAIQCSICSGCYDYIQLPAMAGLRLCVSVLNL